MEEENKTKNCLNLFDGFWQEYKHHSGKVAIGLSILGGVSAILVGKFIIVGSVAIAVTNASVFFTSIAYEKLNGEYKKLDCDNKSLQNEKNIMIKKLTDNHYIHSEISTQTNYEECLDVNKLLNINSSTCQPFEEGEITP